MSIIRLLRYCLVFCSLVGPAASTAYAQDLTGQASVIDGDGIEIHGNRIRLHGVDAPESGQFCLDEDSKQWRCGQQAANALADFIKQSPVSCQKKDTDRYGRMVAVCSARGVNLNAWLVENGWAVPYREYGGYIYNSQEANAQQQKRGIWRGKFDLPGDWRKGKREVSAPSPDVNRTPSPRSEAAANDNTVRQRIIQDSIASYPGSCACPYNTDRAGRRCGARSAYSRAGGYAVLCYESDVSQETVNTFKSKD